jgi:hypothetical protein
VTATLQQHEAVLLAHALVARLADGAGARVLFIKGPTAVALGVRPDRPSTDVDVLVEPPAFESLCVALESAGWVLRAPIGSLRHAGDLAFDHSAHYIHRDWPCDLDVHYNFPGFLAPAQQVFDALWERRTTVEVAGQDVPTPDAVGQALVVGLLALRDPRRPQSLDDLEHVAGAIEGAPGDDSVTAVAELARATGSAQTAEPLLTRLGVPAEPTGHAELTAQLVAWRRRQEFSEAAGSLWLIAFSEAPWHRRPGILLRAAFPPREALLSSHLAAGASRSQVARLHLRRLRRGVAGLPRSVAILRGLGRSGLR